MKRPLALLLLTALPCLARSQCELFDRQKVLPVGASADDWWETVAVDGEWAMYGCSRSGVHGPGRGLVIVYQRVAGVWTEFDRLFPDAGEKVRSFGQEIELEGDRALIAAPEDNHTGTSAGAVYEFRLVGGSWVERARIVASNASSGDDFGHSIALLGDLLVVGAPTQGSRNSGAAYAFRHDGRAWVEEAFWKGPVDPARFGVEVASTQVGGVELALVSDALRGAGGVSTFENSGDGWRAGPDLLAEAGETGDRFGATVEASGARLLISATEARSARGTVYAYEWVDEWNLVQRIAPDLPEFTRFGRALALQDRLALVGRGDHDCHLYALRAGGWSAHAELRGRDVDGFHAFGERVALDGAAAWIANKRDDEVATDAGAAYAFELPPLLLDLSPRGPAVGDSVEMELCLAASRSALQLVLESIDGTPTLLPLLRARADEHGRWELSAVVPPVAAGLELGLAAYAFDGNFVLRRAAAPLLRVD